MGREERNSKPGFCLRVQNDQAVGGGPSVVPGWNRRGWRSGDKKPDGTNLYRSGWMLPEANGRSSGSGFEETPVTSRTSAWTTLLTPKVGKPVKR